MKIIELSHLDKLAIINSLDIHAKHLTKYWYGLSQDYYLSYDSGFYQLECHVIHPDVLCEMRQAIAYVQRIPLHYYTTDRDIVIL